MKIYSVKDIADMLNTNPETVRRWIRAGKLKADRISRKDGNTIREDDLYKYLRSTTKYAEIATSLVATNPSLALTTAVGVGVFGTIITSLTFKQPQSGREARILSDDVKRALKKNIIDREGMIARKRAAIAELQAEIIKEQQQIRDCETALEHLSDALSDLKENDNGEVID